MAFQQVYRIATYLPQDAVDRVLAGICAVVPLRYGRYDCSAWWLAGGTEQHQPIEGAKPHPWEEPAIFVDEILVDICNA